MSRTNQTLIDQMRITEHSLNRRKSMFGFDQNCAKHLMECQPFIEENSLQIVTEFYDHQISIDENSALIGDADTLERLHKAQHAYLISLFSGEYGMDYVSSRLRIGMVHKRIGVAPNLYLSAMQTLKSIVIRFLNYGLDDELSKQAETALEKLLNLDISYVFDTYIRSLTTEIEIGRLKAEAYSEELEQRVRERTRQLEELAIRDVLTDLYNLRFMRDALKRELKLAERNGQPLSLVYFDVDDFKVVNDDKGHAEGDAVLKSIGKCLRAECRETDYPCRYGGDEFCVILINSFEADANEFIRRIRQSLENIDTPIYISAGVVQSGPEIFESMDSLLKKADRLMYEEKKKKPKPNQDSP